MSVDNLDSGEPASSSDFDPAGAEPGGSGAFELSPEPAARKRRKHRRTRPLGESKPKPAAGTAKAKAEVPLDLNGLAGMFAGLHVMLAAKGAPELVITEDESKEFMKRAQAVLRHYSVKTTQKTLDWLMFLGCAGGIYGPRLMALQLRQGQERGARGTPARRGQVLHFPPRADPAAPGGNSAAPPGGAGGADQADLIIPNEAPEFDPAA